LDLISIPKSKQKDSVIITYKVMANLLNICELK